ncbi:Hypp5896 [Branchiostoma lanceolatum]|uniref:Hypp5896 protein n=1 Tax=Branchiostoma lanceolatum TaxID=7740 RepID=A0A8J9VIA7_BRALA|nr:Hypp5896 [Branchiostoma lanceolatum]
MNAMPGQQVFWTVVVVLATAQETLTTRVEVTTASDGIIDHAATDANIVIHLDVVRFTSISTVSCSLDCSGSRCNKDHTDIATCGALYGILKSVTLYNPGGGHAPDWHPVRVKVIDGGHVYDFNLVDTWIDIGESAMMRVAATSCHQPPAPRNGYFTGGTNHNTYGYSRCNTGHPGYYLTSSSDSRYLCYGGYRYPENPSVTCNACRSIANCETYNRCTGSSDSRCTKCRYDRGTNQKAYQLSSDGTLCTQVCSWRPDSKFCYPGRCINNRPSSCTCAPGFGGSNCLAIDSPPVMNGCIGKLKRMVDGTEREAVEASCMSTGSPSTVWTNIGTNITDQIQFEVDWVTSFQGPSTTDWPPQYYIHDHGIGVISASVDWWLERDGTEVSSGTLPCVGGGISRDNPKPSPHCTTSVTMTVAPQHGDSLFFTAKSTNGGYVKVRNYDGTSGYVVNPPIYFSGREIAHTAHFTFDFQPPSSDTTTECPHPSTSSPDRKATAPLTSVAPLASSNAEHAYGIYTGIAVGAAAVVVLGLGVLATFLLLRLRRNRENMVDRNAATHQRSPGHGGYDMPMEIRPTEESAYQELTLASTRPR